MMGLCAGSLDLLGHRCPSLAIVVAVNGRRRQFHVTCCASCRNAKGYLYGYAEDALHGCEFLALQTKATLPSLEYSVSVSAVARINGRSLFRCDVVVFAKQEQPEEFHESLRQIPMRWRSSLSSIMTSMASNGGGDEVGGGQGGGAADGMGVGSDGKRVGEHKVRQKFEGRRWREQRIAGRCIVHSVVAFARRPSGLCLQH